jgi:hypothetical protein
LGRRAGRKHSGRLWTKLAAAVDTRSHFLAEATVVPGPSHDAPQFRPVVFQASLAVTWDRVLADGAFDSEGHHRYAREGLGVRATVIPLNRRNGGRECLQPAQAAARQSPGRPLGRRPRARVPAERADP